MIFVTVGTHEQQFNRLIKEVDTLKEKNIIQEEVFIQTGYSDYEPQFCKWSNFIKYNEMNNYIKSARIIITHGGPASFLSVLQQHKMPIVVPRKSELNEHVNNHQLEFAKKIQKLGYKIYVVENIEYLSQFIEKYKLDEMTFTSNNEQFNIKLIETIKMMF